jgi:hypothetical protein
MPIITLSVEEVTRKRIQVIAKAKRQTLSAVVDTAVELLARQDEFSNLETVVPLGKIDPSSIKGVSKGKVA